MWQMIKLLLTEEAKRRISFPKNKELHALIDDDEAIAIFDSNEPLSWSLETDGDVFFRYDTQQQQRQQQAVLPSPPSSPSRRDSTSSTGTVYYDTETTLPFSARSRRGSVHGDNDESVYATPNVSPSASQQDLLAALIGDGKRLPQRAAALNQQNSSSLTVSERPALSEGTTSESQPPPRRKRQDNKVVAGLVVSALIRAQAFVRKVVLRYKGAVFWIIACIFLRQSIQRLLQMLLTLMGRLLTDYPAKSSTGTSSAGAASVRLLLSFSTGHVGQWSL